MLIIEKSYPSNQRYDQVDSENKYIGQSYMIREKVFNNPYILKVGTDMNFGRVDSRIKDMR